MRDTEQLVAEQNRALAHPIRVLILELFTEGRSLDAGSLAADLITLDDEFRNVTVSQIGYHVERLRDVELLPAAAAR